MNDLIADYTAGSIPRDVRQREAEESLENFGGFGASGRGHRNRHERSFHTRRNAITLRPTPESKTSATIRAMADGRTDQDEAGGSP